MTEYTVEIYSTEEGKEPFSDWLKSLNDKKIQAIVLYRIQRLRVGNLGDFKFFDGMYELRFDLSSGLRIYCARVGNKIFLLLGGGDKSTQKKDIKKCKEYLEVFKKNGKK